VNIVSHLAGAALFFSLPFALYHELGSRYHTASVGDFAVFGLYLFGVAACFTLSVMFHTLMSHSPQGFAIGIQLDFQGIIILMWSASAPMVYYSFYSEPTLQKTYWSLVDVLPLSPRIELTTRRSRALLYWLVSSPSRLLSASQPPNRCVPGSLDRWRSRLLLQLYMA
jgi:predicted membrane channel-forming protein YqfA (hemolysin III family)